MNGSFLVVIDDFDISSFAVFPAEANAILRINANAVLPATVAFESL